jgi:hypothetical protein
MLSDPALTSSGNDAILDSDSDQTDPFPVGVTCDGIITSGLAASAFNADDLEPWRPGIDFTKLHFSQRRFGYFLPQILGKVPSKKRI